MAEATLSIGEVAGKAGVSVSAIRFYERRGHSLLIATDGGIPAYEPLRVLASRKLGGSMR